MKIIHIYRKCKLITARTRCYSDNHPENGANIFAGGGNEMKMIYIKIRDTEWSEGEKRANCVVNFWFSFTFGSIFNQLNAIGICGTNTVVGKAMMEKNSFENYACHLQNKLTAQCWRSMRIGEIASKEIERGRGDKERDSVRIRLVKILTLNRMFLCGKVGITQKRCE